ncbi:MAG: hypothetical protein WCC01_08885, partial [Acidimicrobiia bacterium]
MTRARLTLVAIFVMVAAVLVPIPNALATQDVVVRENALGNQPRIMDGSVHAIDSYGDDVLVGGTFSTIRNSEVTDPEILQKYLFKFNVATGEIDPGFDPVLDGAVEGIEIS